MPYLDEAGLTYFWQKIKTALFGKQDTITGNEGQVVGFDASGNATPVPGWSNQNLADNAAWTSRDSIVNRGGQGLYTNSYCIDRWYLMNGCSCAVSDSGIALHYPSQPSGPYIMGQDVSFFHSLRGKTLTFSVLFESADAPITACVQFHADYHSNVISNVINGSGLASVTCIVPDDAERLFIVINNHTMQEAHVKPLAAKLELGDHQTLAHQNEDGEWEIIDPPDYSLQYLRCSKYSPSTGKWVWSQHSNPNLLDNWYFVGGGSQQGGRKFPINQRGQTEYTRYVNYGYTIDRWFISGGISRLALSANRIEIENNGSVMYFSQRIESLDTSAIYTFSILSAGQLYSVTGVPGTGKVTVTPFGDIRLELRWNDPSIVQPTVCVSSATTITAAKLEFGPVQTLAHQNEDGEWVLNDPPPDFTSELAKCQSYQTVFQAPSIIGIAQNYSEDWCYFSIFVPTQMRIPVFSSLNKIVLMNGVYISDGTHPIAAANIITQAGVVSGWLKFSGLTVGEKYFLAASPVSGDEPLILDANI